MEIIGELNFYETMNGLKMLFKSFDLRIPQPGEAFKLH